MITTTADVDAGRGAHLQSFITRGVQKAVLPNGLTVITKELHDKPIVASIIWYRVGSRNEELGQTGKSHFLEHMLFKGTDKYMKGEIDMITLENGGANNAFTWLDFTAYYFTFASDRWEAALEIEANRMRNTTFAQDEFEAEKQVVEEELRIGLDGPWEALENEVWATAFRQHPYHWPTVGWLEDLKAATAEDMRAYYDKWYHPRNATLVIVGDFNTAETLAKVEHLFGSIPPGPEAKPLHIVEPPQRGEKRVIVKKQTPVERLLIGYHAPAVADPDSYPLHVIEAILSTGKASRLFRRLVEKDQSVTNAKANYNAHIDPTLFYIQAELKPGFALGEVEEAIYEEIAGLKTGPITAAELEKAKRQIEADLVLSSEASLQQAILIGQYETVASDARIPEECRGYNYIDTLIDRIRAVTPEDIARVAQKYFVQDNRTVGYLIDDSNWQGISGHEATSLNFRKSSGVVASDVALTPAHPGALPDDRERYGPVSRVGRQAERAAFRSGVPGETTAEKIAAGLAQGDNGNAILEDADSVVRQKPPGGAKASEFRAEQSLSVSNGNQDSKVKPKLDVERVELPNGLILLLSENHSSPSVSINVVVKAGSRFEPDDKAGLASLVGELIDEGTATRASQEIAELIESAGGRVASFGDYQASGVKAAFLSKDIMLGLDIVADMVTNAIFPEDKIRQHIERRAAQIKSRLDVPRVQASDAFNEIIFKGHPQHRPSVGYQESVKNLTRQDLLDFYRRFYVPNNTVLAIVGDIDKAHLKNKIQELFSNWPPAADFKPPELPGLDRQTQAIKKFVHAPKEQVNIFIGHVGIERKCPDYYALLVMDTILGSSPGFTSRIPRILRDEQGLAYTTFSNITSSAGVDPGRFIAYIGTSPENLDRAIEGLQREIARIVKEPVAIEELESAKAYLTGNFVFSFQTNGQVADFLVDAEVYGLGFDYLEKYPEMIRAVAVEDVTRVTRKYLDPDHLTTVVVGPVDEHGRVMKNGNADGEAV